MARLKWDIKVCEGALGYLCNDGKLLSGGGIIPVPGCQEGSNFVTKRDTFYYIEELVMDKRDDNNRWGYVVLQLPKNDVAKYFVVSTRDGKIEFRNG